MNIPEYEAAPDEAFDLGTVSGYDEGYRDGRKKALKEVAAAVTTSYYVDGLGWVVRHAPIDYIIIGG